MPMKHIGDYAIVRELGSGASCKVLLGEQNDTGRKVAVKFFRKSKEGKESFWRERTALRRISHPNVISLNPADEKFNSSPEAKDRPVLVLPFASKGDLLDLITKNGPLDEPIARTIFKQITDGLGACHGAGVIHRDLKPENILLDESYTPIICDFGFSALRPPKSSDQVEHYRKSTMLTKAGSIGYMAPEMVEGKAAHGELCDLWSLGVCAFVMIAGFPPYAAPRTKDFWYRKLIEGDFQIFWRAHGRHAKFSDDFKQMLESLLCRDPSQRKSLSDVLKSKWLSGKHASKEEVAFAFTK
uniref:Protein kinase domain-containing protein n=1 Tax=Lotharella oceanica TaxID=641309 RepID=A0A7S2TTP7_9EUKA|mmetsp:Transcript_26960/g.50328  ORF Transcript_26960/g.50328 Transcript_26960/m.50328 type:complete len:299 (+) Transcript_26960:67-963(+)